MLHVEAEHRSAAPMPVDHQQRIGDAVALADRPGPMADFPIDRLPKLVRGLFAGGGHILDRARVARISRRAAHVTECNLNGR